MQQERNGRRSNARASAASFPDDDARAPSPSHADASHIARRRASSAPAHEVDLDEVELVDPAPEPRRPRWAPPPVLARFRGKVVARPVDPPRFSEQPPESVNRPRLAPSPRATSSRVPRFVTLGAAGALATLALVAVNRRPSAPHAAPPATASTPATTTTSAPVPVADVQELPRSATTGTVIGAHGHRLWIDGVLAQSWGALVRCGEHLVQVGSAGTPRKVDVPCGAEVVVSP